MSKMLWVNIELDDVDTDDLIDELEGRHLDEQEKKILFDIASDSDPKVKLFMQVKEQFSLVELQEMLMEKNIGCPPSENQLKLEI